MLLRDIFRFGTATVLSSSVGPVGPVLGLVVLLGAAVSVGQRRPPRVDRLLVPVVRVVREPRTTLDAQTRTVVPAQRLERQCKHHRVPQQWLEVEQVALEPADLVVLVGVVARASS